MTKATLIPFALPLPQRLPTIEGNVDYRDFRNRLQRIDELLVRSGLETQMLEADLQRWLAEGSDVSAKLQQQHQSHGRCALRCNIARLLLQEGLRGFAVRLADSPLMVVGSARSPSVASNACTWEQCALMVCSPIPRCPCRYFRYSSRSNGLGGSDGATTILRIPLSPR